MAAELATLCLSDLRNIIDAESLTVSKGVGGKSGRTRLDVVEDIKAARTGAPNGARAVVTAGAKASNFKPFAYGSANAEADLAGNMRLERIRLAPNSRAVPARFLTELFGSRVRIYETELPSASVLKGPNAGDHIPQERIEEHDGTVFELISFRTQRRSANFWGGKTTDLEWYYIETAGYRNGKALPPIDVEAIMDSHGDFRDVPTRKACARLELYTSPAADGHVHYLRAADFELVSEPLDARGREMADGCGFLPEVWLSKLGLDATCLGIQLRIFAPRLGIFKGVLAVKPGIETIQLVPSMRKVPPTLEENPADWAALLINQSGVFPAKSATNIGKRLAGERHHKTPYETPLKRSGMLENQWLGQGVPQRALAEYRAEGLARYNAAFGVQQKEHPLNNHASVIGLRDPTGRLPFGVFVTGLSHRAGPGGVGAPPPMTTGGDTIYVTRYPCVKPSDGPLLPLITTKPATMDAHDWEWLCTRPFGALYFSTAGPEPLPLLCAKGDLDGDLYVVCWDEKIQRHICPTALVDEGPVVVDELVDTPADAVALAAAEGTSDLTRSAREATAVGGRSWLQRVQAHMTSPDVLHELVDMGKYYAAWQREVESCEEGTAGVDAISLGEAFAQTLERPKHGEEIRLPSHLLGKVKGVRGSAAGGGARAATPSKMPSTLASLPPPPPIVVDLSPAPPIKLEEPPPTTPRTVTLEAPRQSRRVPVDAPSPACSSLASLSLNELKRIIDSESLPVSKGTGGTARRTKVDIAADIERCRACST